MTRFPFAFHGSVILKQKLLELKTKKKVICVNLPKLEEIKTLEEIEEFIIEDLGIDIHLDSLNFENLSRSYKSSKNEINSYNDSEIEKVLIEDLNSKMLTLVVDEYHSF